MVRAYRPSMMLHCSKPRSMRTMVTYITEFRESSNPFKESYGVETFVPLDDVLGREIDIYDVERFENQNGPGVYILAKEPVVGKDGDFFYMCTHSVGITETLSQDKVKEALAKEPIRATIIKRKSQKSDRMVYSFE